MGNLAIRIGAGTQEYNDIALAYSMRGNQKLAITGSGTDIKAALSDLNTYAAGIGSIKSTSDIVVSAANTTSYKAALLKLGTRSLVLQSDTVVGGAETNSAVTSNFTALDAVYTKFKAMNIDSAPTVAALDLQGAVNLSGMEVLSGKIFKVTGTASEIKTSMASLLKNVSKIDTITITGGGVAEFSLSQLKTLGDKLVKAGGSTVKLVDTANNLLQTSAIDLINKYNNTNINSGVVNIATVNATSGSAAGVLTSNSHTLSTGDKVTYAKSGTTAIDTLTDGTQYYVRKLSSNTFALYDTLAHAADVTSLEGRKAVSNAGNGTADRFITSNADAPTRVTTLDKVDVTNATLAQARQLTTLTTSNGVTTANVKNRTLSDIIGNVQIKDTATNLSAGSATLTLAVGNSGAVNDTTDVITSNTHGYKTGDAVYYEKTASAATIGLTSGTTYYVGRITDNTFALFDTRAHAMAGNNDTATAVGMKDLSTGYVAGAHKFTTSTLDKTMSEVARYNNASGTVSRVTIEGYGDITSTTIAAITSKVQNGGNSSGFGTATKIAYSAKAVDIQKNIQALYDSVTTTTNTPLTEIVVTDGTNNGKKAITVSMSQYTGLNGAFSLGVTNPAGDVTAPTNYAFTVTGAAYADSQKAGGVAQANSGVTLQDDKNVASFYVTNVSKGSIDTLGELRDFLSQSKLKTAYTESQSANSWTVTDKSTLTTLLQQIGSNVDRAKLKIAA